MSLLDTPKPPPAPASAKLVRPLDEREQAQAPLTMKNQRVRVRPAPGARRGRMRWYEQPDCVKARALRGLLVGPAQRQDIAALLKCRPEDIDWATKDLCSEGYMRRLGAHKSRWYDLTPAGRELAQRLESQAQTPTPPARRRPAVDAPGARTPVNASSGDSVCEPNAGSRRGPVADKGPPSPDSTAVSRYVQRWLSCGIFVIGLDATHVRLAIPLERLTDPSVLGVFNVETR